MGIKEYHFLTDTLKKIEINSNTISNERSEEESLLKRKRELEEDLSVSTKLWNQIDNHNRQLKSIVSEKNLGELKEERKNLKQLAERKTFVEGFSFTNWLVTSLIFWVVGGFFLFISIIGFGVGGFACDNGEHVPHFFMNDGEDDCGDNSDEENANSGSIRFLLFSLFAGFIFCSWGLRFTKPDGWQQKLSQINDELAMYNWHKRERKKSLEMIESMGESDIEHLSTEINLLMNQIEICMDNIERLEKQTDELWNSITHLIPFSTALEKK